MKVKYTTSSWQEVDLPEAAITAAAILKLSQLVSHTSLEYRIDGKPILLQGVGRGDTEVLRYATELDLAIFKVLKVLKNDT